MRNDYEYIIIGLGGIGSAAAYWLARRAGSAVLGLEQFELGHGRGASQDHSRIIRLSYHTPTYVRLAQQAYAAWDVVASEAGEQLVIKTGGLDLEPAGTVMPIDDYILSMNACGIPFELLDAPEIMRRWPQFRLSDDVRGLYQADAGIATAARSNAAHQRLARAYGATLLDNTPVTHIRPFAGEIEVQAAGTTYRCRKLVIAADAWTNDILAYVGMHVPLTITQEQVTYFAPSRLEDFQPERFPIWIWMDEPSFYGLPVFGEAGIKIGQDVGGREVTASTRTFDTDQAALARATRFLQRYIPQAPQQRIYTKSCLYTMPPDRDFIIDTLPDHPNIAIAQGAAHAFKYAALVGKILSELSIDGATDSDIASFAVDRPILTQADPPKHFLV